MEVDTDNFWLKFHVHSTSALKVKFLNDFRRLPKIFKQLQTLLVKLLNYYQK